MLRGEIELSGETRARIAGVGGGKPAVHRADGRHGRRAGCRRRRRGGPHPADDHCPGRGAARQLGLGEQSVLEQGLGDRTEFSRNALFELIPKDEWPAVGGALEGLVRRELLRPVRDEAFRFRHLLLLEVAYDTVLKFERADLHERHGDWVEQNGGDEEIVGYHSSRAYAYRSALGPVDAEGRALARRAATRLGAAGRRAAERGDLHAAVGLLSRATDLLELARQGEELLTDLGEALRETGEFDRAESVLEEVIQTASAAGDDVLEARAQVIRLRLRLLTDPEVTEEVARQAEPLIETFERAGDDRLLAKAWSCLRGLPGSIAGRRRPWMHSSERPSTHVARATPARRHKASTCRSERPSVRCRPRTRYGFRRRSSRIRRSSSGIAPRRSGRWPASRRWWARSARHGSWWTRTRRSCR